MRRPRPLLLVAAALVTAATTLLTVPAQADGGDQRFVVPAFETVRRDSHTAVREISVKWAGDTDRDYAESARVPGVGSLKLVCRPNNTIIKLTADSRTPETQMWLSKFEDKGGRPALAVKNARIYRYANANDDGTGGTGRSAHEGLNQRGNVENWARGYAYGLISQRPGRHLAVGDSALEPATSFYFTWYWNGLDHDRPYQSCEFRLRMVTHLDESLGLSWHGNADATGHEVRTTPIPGLGDLAVTCRTGGRDEDQWITLAPSSSDPAELQSAYADYTVYSGEGLVEDHAETTTGYSYDPLTGLIGPIDLPRNGMLRIKYVVGPVTRWFYVSSYMVLNNEKNPALNLCEVAIGGGAQEGEG